MAFVVRTSGDADRARAVDPCRRHHPGSSAAHFGRQHDGSAHRDGAVAAAIHVDAHRVLRLAGARAQHGRRLRRHGVFGRAANARDRDPHSARGDRPQCADAGGRQGDLARGRGRRRLALPRRSHCRACCRGCSSASPLPIRPPTPPSSDCSTAVARAGRGASRMAGDADSGSDRPEIGAHGVWRDRRIQRHDSLHVPSSPRSMRQATRRQRATTRRKTRANISRLRLPAAAGPRALTADVREMQVASLRCQATIAAPDLPRPSDPRTAARRDAGTASVRRSDLAKILRCCVVESGRLRRVSVRRSHR